MSIFSDLKPTNHTDSNGFDLGRFSTFSTKCGYCLPVFNQPTLPDGEYSLDIKQLLRTQPLQKAAFTGFSVNYDVIWSPYNHHYSSFNQFIAQRENKNLTNQPLYNKIPTFSLGGCLEYVFYHALYDYIMSYVDFVGFYDTFKDNQDIRLSWVCSHNPNDSVCLNVIRNLDMLGYGNFLPLLKNSYARLTRYSKFYYSSTDDTKWLTVDWTSFSDIIDSNNNNVTGVRGFFKFILGFTLGLPTENTFSDFVNAWRTFLEEVPAAFNDPSRFYPIGSPVALITFFREMYGTRCNLFAPLAYNKAFYEYYRNSYFDTTYDLTAIIETDLDYSLNYVYSYNVDDFPSFGSVEGLFYDLEPDDFARFIMIFNVKPHLYKRDMITGVMPSTQFGDVSMMFTDTDFHKLIGNFHIAASNSIDSGQVFAGSDEVNYIKNTSGSVSSKAERYKFDPSLAISVLESRRADAMQRFKERMMRAGDKTKDIFKAHGWSEPKSELSFEPIFLGSFDGRMDINVVAATAESDNTELAQLGANGMCTVSGSKVKIKTSDFGVLFVVMHIEKDAVYDAYGVDVAHSLNEPFDYPYPVLQNISLAPVDRKFLNVMDNRADVRDIIGFLPRAIGYKTALDKVHGEFFSSLPYETNYTNSDIDPEWFEKDIQFFSTGAFADWVAPREDVLQFNQKSFLYVSPNCVDTIFKQMSNVRQESDQFFVNVRFDCYAVEPLPVIGLPI